MNTNNSPPYFSLLTIKANEHTIMAVLAALVGVISGFGAIGFRYLIDFIQSSAYGAAGNLLLLVESIPWYVRIIIPAAGGDHCGK